MKNTTIKKKISIKAAYKGDSGDSQYINTVKENLETPIVTLQFCGIFKPQYFSGSHIPRYKVQVYIDKNLKEHKKYLEELENLAKEFGVSVLGRTLDTGLILMTYQGRIKPEIFLVENGSKIEEPIELEHDLPEGFKCRVNFTLKKYYDRYKKQNAFNFSPNKIIFYLDEETQNLIEVKNGEDQNFRD